MQQKWLVMIVVGFRTFMAALDRTIISVALPTIAQDLNASLALVQWVVTGYALVNTSTVIIVGYLGDILGRKRLFDIGMIVFTVGSALSGLSRSVEQLIAFRILQSVGASMLIGVGIAILAEAFPSNERGKVLGINVSINATAQSLGPSVGGFVVEAWGWPAIFFINVPIGIVGAIAGFKILQEDHKHGSLQSTHVDIRGATTLFSAVAFMLLALSWSEQASWFSPILLGMLGLSIFSAVAFLHVESRTSNPIIEPGLFRNKLFAAANSSALLNHISSNATLFFLPFYLQNVLGYSPVEIGLLLMSVPLASLLLGPVSGYLSDTMGSRTLCTIGMIIMSAGLVMFSMIKVDPSYVDILLPLLLVGVGDGLFRSPNNSAAMGAVDQEKLGIASGVLATMRNLGRIVGISLAVALFSAISSQSQSVLPTEATNGNQAELVIQPYRYVFIFSTVFALSGTLTSYIRGKRDEFHNHDR